MRLVTRGDVDGVTAAVVLSTVEPVDAIELIHPQDITDGRFAVTGTDIMANLPYHPAAALWFDHHELTASNRRPPEGFRGRHRLAPSVARVIYEHYGAERFARYEELVRETDRFVRGEPHAAGRAQSPGGDPARVHRRRPHRPRRIQGVLPAALRLAPRAAGDRRAPPAGGRRWTKLLRSR